MYNPVKRRTYDFDVGCKMLGISETTGRKKKREGLLPVLQIGRRVLITDKTMEAILHGEIDLNAPPPNRRDLTQTRE
jgi:hypothetical protein